jgi:hypothetical protein
VIGHDPPTGEIEIIGHVRVRPCSDRFPPSLQWPRTMVRRQLGDRWPVAETYWPNTREAPFLSHVRTEIGLFEVTASAG